MRQKARRQGIDSEDCVHQATLAAAEGADDSEVEAILRQSPQQLPKRFLAFRVLAFCTLEHRGLGDGGNLQLEIVVAANCLASDIRDLWRGVRHIVHD
ncbi:MAG: hypothetical protein WA005_17475 [Candidatus Binataceae bacterium]